MLDEAGIPYMVVGSYASAFHGEPRMTQDIDMVVDPDSESIKLLINRIDRDRSISAALKKRSARVRCAI